MPGLARSVYVKCAPLSELCMGEMFIPVSALELNFGGSASSAKHLKINYLTDTYSTIFIACLGCFCKFQRQQNISLWTNTTARLTALETFKPICYNLLSK